MKNRPLKLQFLALLTFSDSHYYMSEHSSHAKTTQRRKRDKYKKIPLKSKLVFYEKVLHQHANLQEVAERLGIKYSTAKTLIRNYKFMPEEEDEDMVQALVRDFEKREKPRQRCSYQRIDDPTDSSWNVERGQNIHGDKNFPFPKIEIVSSFLNISQQ